MIVYNIDLKKYVSVALIRIQISAFLDIAGK